MKQCRKQICIAAGAAAGYFLVTMGGYLPFVIRDARKHFRESCRYLLILGGEVIGADTPGPQLLARMQAAEVYLHENPEVIAVPCGGCFRPGQKKSEAEIIAAYLRRQGIAPERILKEENSTTTFENFEFALPIIQRHAAKPLSQLDIGLLTSDYHIHRAAIIARRCGVQNAKRVACRTPGAAYKAYIREYIVAYQLLCHGAEKRIKQIKAARFRAGK